MAVRGFGLEMESTYGSISQGTRLPKSDFDPDWWNQADEANFKLNNAPVTKSGSSRMKKRARAGVKKPTGSTKADADLQQLGWYFRGYLDNYKFTEGSTPASGHEQTHTHEFWGGEGALLPSFRGVVAYDNLIKYLYGLLVDKMKLECSNDSMTVSADWIYQTEAASKLTGGATITVPDELTNEDLFIMFYDLDLKINNNPLGVTTSLTIEGDNGHNVDNTIGFGSSEPQKRAFATERQNKISLTTTLTDDTIDAILAAQYGAVDVLEPTKCKILQQSLKLTITHCEDPDISCIILFPECTILAEFDMSGVDEIQTTLTLESLGCGEVTLADNTTEVVTDMYIKLVNNQEEIVPAE